MNPAAWKKLQTIYNQIVESWFLDTINAKGLSFMVWGIKKKKL